MREYLLPVALVIVFTLVYSCSDNMRQKKLDKKVEKALSKVQKAQELIYHHQQYLERELSGQSQDTTAIRLPWPVGKKKSDRQTLSPEYHQKLSEQADRLIQSAWQYRGMINEENIVLEKTDIARLNVQVAELLKKSKKLPHERQKNSGLF